MDHLTVPDIGTGAIINPASSVGATAATVLSLTDNITTEDLVACFNFLNGAVEEKPDSPVFEVINTAQINADAQIVSKSFDSVFPSGVGIAYFEGICDFFSGIAGGGNTKSSYYTTPFPVSAQYLQSPYRPLSYMTLPNDVDDFQSLMYRNSGFTFETWAYMPTLSSTGADGWDTSFNASSLHRIVLGNENRGGDYKTDNVEILTPNKDLFSVYSVLMGFTRDRRFTKNAVPSNNLWDNPIDGDLKFYMAPVQSVNTSALTFIRRPGPDGECHPELSTGQRYLGLVVDASSIDCSSGFKLITVTADPDDDGVVSIYCNGSKLKSQSFTETFGFKGPPNIPGSLNASSFIYNNVYKDSLPTIPVKFIPSSVYQGDFWTFDGPKAGGFTPWIVGGGYSDGMTNLEFGFSKDSDAGMNFMGSEHGGKRSGLNGFLGSVKLYKRAVTQEEAMQNYDAQKGFFENIEL